MWDQQTISRQISRRSDFYNRYVQQHSQMTSWLQHIHQHHYYNVANQAASMHWTNNDENISEQQGSHTSSLVQRTSISCVSEELDETSEESDESSSDVETTSEDSEDSDSDGSSEGLELNVDAILAFRESKEVSEDDSFEKLDVSPEDFEFVELGSLKTMESKRIVFKKADFNEEEQSEMEVMKFLYGDQSSTISGLETCMNINFNHLCDLYQPILWPVLPVRL
ncbi:gem-associated protein 8-like [Uloborus diversus]|uniref:gem-associated protein 8-like n=1 Tax=Uloborus diversus TaxID=327109 RepID=UPI00240A9514|nr:gem-associated protein 8-like [Uloborus diversus]XP_054717506.1 gem-associated protein 8-like [Uloborus diversus]